MPDDLLRGFERFRKEAYFDERSIMQDLVEKGQNPNCFVISCIDSRCNPATIFKSSPGKFFTFNAMGAIVRPYETGTALSAGLQFGIEHKNIEYIILMGHTGCGAIEALVDNLEDEEIGSFITVAQQGLENAKKITQDGGNLYRIAEEQILLESRKNLQTYPVVQSAVAAGTVKIVTWLFDMHHGQIFEYDEDKDDFILVSSPNTTKEQRAL